MLCLCRSFRVSAGSPACLETASDSPVRMDSFTASPAACISALSAGTLSPASSRTKSPQTSSRAGMVCHLPSRHAVAVGAVRLRRDSSVCSVRYSCKKPRIALSRTMRIMVTASVISPETQKCLWLPAESIPSHLGTARETCVGDGVLLPPPVRFRRPVSAVPVRFWLSDRSCYAFFLMQCFPSFVQCCPSSFQMMFLFVATICGKAKKHDHIGKLFVKITRKPLTIVPNSCII